MDLCSTDELSREFFRKERNAWRTDTLIHNQAGHGQRALLKEQAEHRQRNL